MFDHKNKHRLCLCSHVIIIDPSLRKSFPNCNLYELLVTMS
jgi:hypothetical protein